MTLNSRKKFGFIDGSISKPADGSPTLADWTANNHFLVGWIKQIIEPKLRSSNWDPSRQCSSCGRMGHEAASCFKVVGYPEWYGSVVVVDLQDVDVVADFPRANSTQIIGANTASDTPTLALTDEDLKG